MTREFDAVLFDLDGTLVDTAPDMTAAVNAMLGARGREALPYPELRPLVSHGSVALVERAFGPQTPAAKRALIDEFLETYARDVASRSAPFEGIDPLLDALDARGVQFGVVTNKPGHLSNAVLNALGLMPRLQTHVAGDTLAQRKPHPMPMFHAAREMDVLATRCLYAGDAQRDIAAGRAAGMTTIAARYGYILPDDCATRWGADYIAESVAQLSQQLLALTDAGEDQRAHL